MPPMHGHTASSDVCQRTGVRENLSGAQYLGCLPLRPPGPPSLSRLRSGPCAEPRLEGLAERAPRVRVATIESKKRRKQVPVHASLPVHCAPCQPVPSAWAAHSHANRPTRPDLERSALTFRPLVAIIIQSQKHAACHVRGSTAPAIRLG
jgi:hypothetical protein